MRVVPLLTLLLAACGPDVNVTKHDVDADGDGYTTDVDCDDAHATVNPDAPELCDGLDNDCDDTTDEDASDATTWYADADGDGHGDADAATLACEAPAGAVTEADDCDDADASAFPGATELCDGADDDCDGAVDEDAEDVGTFYVDGDGDGYGDAATAITACEPGLGEVEDGTDCDDADAAIHPDAPEEDCADPTDYNCDGSVGYADRDTDGVPACEDCDDEDAGRSPLLSEVCDDLDVDEDCDAVADSDDPSVDPATWSTWYGDADSDGHGDPGGSASACEAPDGYVADAADCDDTTAAVSPSATERCDAADVDEDCDGSADDADTGATGTSTFYRDADADTYGNPAATTSACDLPDGYVTNDDDCDDTSAGISPADTEVCDAANVDEDCDGAADNADASATGTSTFYRDADTDTYGDPAVTTAACDTPTGYVTNDDDCNDASAAISPADTEVCDAANVDEDCDGNADDADTGASGKSTFYRDADTDTYGNPAVTASACDTPAGYVTNDDDCDDASAAISPADTEVCDASNVDEDCDGNADDADTSATGKGTFYRDADSDTYGNPAVTSAACDIPTGYVANDDDCNDGSAAISPADTEVCDAANVDEDCDGTADDFDTSATGKSTWYRDADTDTYGNPSVTTAACDTPSGYVSNDDDCNDTTAAISPADTEMCDAANVDEDCDGTADDADTSATGKSTFYRDADIDTYGSASVTTAACDLPSGYVTNDDDCNDASAAISPADAEVCDASNVDEDCDGAADDADTSATGKTTWYRDADGDTYGVSTTTLSRCDQPSGYVTPSSDCDDVHADAFPGGVEVCEDGIDQDCSGDDEECPPVRYDGDYDVESADHLKLYGRIADEWFGETMAGGDFDGDGVGDLIVGSSQYKTKIYEGSVLGYYGPFPTGVQYAEDVDSFTRGAATFEGSETFGKQVYNLGDLDEDGADDIAAYFEYGPEWFFYPGGLTNSYGYAEDAEHVDFWGYNCTYVAGARDVATAAGREWLCAEVEAPSWRGAIYVHQWNRYDDPALAAFTGEANYDYAGTGLAGGRDIDGDGVDDIAIGAPHRDEGGVVDAGALYLVYGPVSGTASLAAADMKLTGTYESDMVGQRIRLPGDDDGDGRDDLVVSAPYMDPEGHAKGAIYVVTDPAAGTVESYAAGKVVGAGNYDAIGMETLDVGDFDGDGRWDILVSDHEGTGEVWVAYGPIEGTVDLATEGARWTGANPYDYLGYSIAAVPDSDGDGRDEIAMGAILQDYGSTSEAKSNRGAVYIWLGAD